MDGDQGDSTGAIGHGSSAYATGGGGVVLEHTFGATLLAALLLGDPVPGLGDEQSVVRLAFQAGRISPVDDLVVFGLPREGRGGVGRQLALGVRRRPQIAPSDDSFVALIGDYLQSLQDNWKRIQSGQLRLGLVVAGPHSGAHELADLAQLARAHPDCQVFRDAVSSPGATTSRVRTRLVHFERVVAQAARRTGLGLPAGGAEELAWRLLVGLRVIETRLEGEDAPDRTAAVARLRSICGEAYAADALFAQLERLASRYAPAGATVDEAILRRDLSGLAALDRSPSRQRAWDILDDLGRRLRLRTGHELRGGPGERSLTLERSTARGELVRAMADVGAGTLVITGAPDVGKSALALAALDELRTRGAVAIELNLRDLPRSVLEVNRVLDAPLPTVLGGMEVAPIRLLLVDGAEAALEDRFDLLHEVGQSARAAGIGLVAVTRSDATQQVVEALTHGGVGGTSGPPPQVEAAGLTSEEIQEVVAAFPVFARIADEPRSAWLMARPGLVDLILRADAFAALPDGALSEADVFAVVWRKLVRRDERLEPNRGSPDGREAALLELARLQLVLGTRVGSSSDPTALPALRSDGLLLAPGPTAAWSRGDQFATDLVRDFAVTRLLLLEDWRPLFDGGAPRWALRAARLACQAKLADSGATVERALSALQEVFDELASSHGDRWADLPLEAVVTLGSPHGALESAWPALIASNGEYLKRLLRLVLQRYTNGYAADPVLVEPVVQVLLDHAPDLRSLPQDVRASAEEIKLRWLRGLALRADQDRPNPLRARIRDQLLARDLVVYDKLAHERLSLLGPDLDEPTEQHLRRLAVDAPAHLEPCVESLAADTSMASHRPELLLYLAEAYYIEQDDPDDLYDWHPDDDGIRHHTYHGLGATLAAWYYGPFFQMLRARPWETLAFINRMLERGARARLRNLLALDTDTREADRNGRGVAGLELDLPGLGRRFLVGDGDIWAWYRGSTVGPYPCISALAAAERFADQALALGMDLRTLTARLLTDSTTLAMAGLVVGFLTRHLDEVTDELDPWLAEPEVWEFEFARSIREGQFHAQGRDRDDLPGRANRGWTFREVAARLTLRAIAAGDEAALARLRSVADKLEERAFIHYRTKLSAAAYEERMETVRMWASFLRAESYQAVHLADGRAGIGYTPPVASEALQAQQRDLYRGMRVTRLHSTYAFDESRTPEDVAALQRDLKEAMELSGDLPEWGRPFARDAFAAVAAAALIASVDGRCTLGRDDAGWAAAVVLDAARATPDREAEDPSMFAMGSDRSAALALPCLMLPEFWERDPSWLGEEDLDAVVDALMRLMRSGSGEVRRRTALALGRVWRAPCTPVDGAWPRCRHLVALEAVEAAARDCRMGPFDVGAQHRSLLPVEGNLAEVLDAIPADDLRVGRLIAPIVAACSCVSSNCCVSREVFALRNALLRTHARGVVFRARQDHRTDHNPEAQRMLAEQLLSVAGEGDTEVLRNYLSLLIEEPAAVSPLLRELASAATYDAAQRKALSRIWPDVMTIGLDALDADRYSTCFTAGRGREHSDNKEHMIAALLPTPQLRLDDLNADATLDSVRGDWVDLNVLEPLIRRWLPFAVGQPHCVDSLVSLLRTAPLFVQATHGFDWVVQVIDGHHDAIASRAGLIVYWLEELREACILDGRRQAEYQVLVDGLAAHGNSRAVALQKRLE